MDRKKYHDETIVEKAGGIPYEKYAHNTQSKYHCSNL